MNSTEAIEYVRKWFAGWEHLRSGSVEAIAALTKLQDCAVELEVSLRDVSEELDRVIAANERLNDQAGRDATMRQAYEHLRVQHRALRGELAEVTRQRDEALKDLGQEQMDRRRDIDSLLRTERELAEISHQLRELTVQRSKPPITRDALMGELRKTWTDERGWYAVADRALELLPCERPRPDVDTVAEQVGD